MFLYSDKGIELYICFFGNASKMRGEVKFAIKVISITFSSLLFLLVTLLDVRSVWSSSFTLNSYDISHARSIYQNRGP